MKKAIFSEQDKGASFFVAAAAFRHAMPSVYKKRREAQLL